MRKPLSALLILALTAPLAACGQAAPIGLGLERQGTRLDRRSADGATHADRFAEALRTTFRGKLRRTGEVVTLESEDIIVHYDFSRADETGQVRITSEGFETEMALSEVLAGAKSGEVGTEALPVLLVPIATQVAIAAAKALAMYYITHRGEEFDKSDAIKVTVVAMTLAVVPFVGSLGTFGQFVPIAGKLLASSSSFAFKDLAKAAVSMVDEIVPLVVWLIKQRKKSEAAAY